MSTDAVGPENGSVRPGLDEDAKGSPANARFLLVASELAYLDEATGRATFLTQLGLEARLVSVGNTQGWVGLTANHVVVAFRGTESPLSLDGLKDMLVTDAMNLLVVPEGRLGHDLAAAGVGARFHKGFTDALADIWEPIAAVVEVEMKKSDRPLWITGHSLGGALALLSAWLFKRRMVPVHEAYTFGAPMVGNREACEAFNREFAGRIHRYVNGRDPVPKLPALSLVANEFGHVDSERLLGSDPALPLSSVLSGIASRAAGGLLSGTLVDEAWEGITSEVASHFLDRYRRLLG
jgi:triacylglycerol lipase